MPPTRGLRFRSAQLRNLIQQLHRLRRTRNPRRRARKSSLEVVCAGAEELVADVERAAAFDAAEVILAGHYAPAFVADVDEDVVAAWNWSVRCIVRKEHERGE